MNSPNICAECGSVVETSNFCTNCGKNVQLNRIYSECEDEIPQKSNLSPTCESNSEANQDDVQGEDSKSQNDVPISKY